MLIDEAVEVAKTVSNGDSNAILCALLPLQHASTDKETVMKNKRVLEDKIMGLLDWAQCVLYV